MVLEKKQEQENIKNWFDKTYSSRGEYYLRPVKAYYVFLELLKVKKGNDLLDVACGLGRLLEAGKEYGCSLTGIDLSDVAVEKAKLKIPQAEIVQGNAENLPFENEQFDYVTCLGSLERVINKNQVLQEMQRVTRETAQFCFLVRNSESFSWKYIKKLLGLKNKKGHQGAMDLEAWTNLFDANGFQVEQVLHDQYPLHKAKKWKSFGLKNVDYKKTVNSSKAINEANEFLFILSKNN